MGAGYGFKLAKNPIHKAGIVATGALIGSRMGAFLGAGVEQPLLINILG